MYSYPARCLFVSSFFGFHSKGSVFFCQAHFLVSLTDENIELEQQQQQFNMSAAAAAERMDVQPILGRSISREQIKLGTEVSVGTSISRILLLHGCRYCCWLIWLVR